MINLDLYPRLDDVKEREYILKAQEGSKEALDYLTLSNSRLVASIATTLVNSVEGKGLDFDDLFQVGILGMMKAVEKFNLTIINIKLGTYAYKWIHQYMVQVIENQSRTIRLPAWVSRKNFSLIVDAKKLEFELERTATNQELAKYSGKTIKQVEEYKSDMCIMKSLDQKVGNEEGIPLGELLTDGTDIASDIVEKLTNSKILNYVNSLLTEREFDIFIAHTVKRKTFNEISNKYSLTTSRIQQIYRNTLGKLQRNSRLKMYREVV